MMYSTGRDCIVKAKINDDIIIIDLASPYLDSYDDIPREKEYLGKGVYYSYDDQLSTDTKEYHFWKYKKNNMLNLHTYPYPEITGLQAMSSNLKTDPILLQEAKDRGFYGGFDGIEGMYNNLYLLVRSKQGSVTHKIEVPEEIRTKIWKYCNAYMNSTYAEPAQKQAICAMLMSEIFETGFIPKPTTKKQLTKLEAQTLLFQTMLQMSNRELESVLYYLDNGKTTSGFEVTDK